MSTTEMRDENCAFAFASMPQALGAYHTSDNTPSSHPWIGHRAFGSKERHLEEAEPLFQSFGIIKSLESRGATAPLQL
jgi:hypothetical protein